MKDIWILVLSVICILLFTDRLASTEPESVSISNDIAAAKKLGLNAVAPDRKAVDSLIRMMPVTIKAEVAKAAKANYHPETAISAVSRDKNMEVKVDAVVIRTNSGAAILSGRSRVYEDGKLLFDKPFEKESVFQVTPKQHRKSKKVGVMAVFDGRKFSIGPTFGYRIAGPVWISAGLAWSNNSVAPASGVARIDFEW